MIVKILLIASTDSYNFSLPRLFTCFKNKGHEVTVLQTEYGKEHNFAIKNLPVKKYFGTVRNIRSYDFAVFENVLNEELLNQLHSANVFCVSMYFHAFPMQYVLGSGYLYGNLTFSLGENFKEAQQRNGVIQEIIPIGSPQYDDMEVDSQSSEKTLLFLEQHFYPAGDKGKQQLATTLIETAENNPDYKIIVKPRSLPKYHDQSKHKSKHIYSYIEKQCENKLPDNLVLLNEHKDLLELINQSCVVATTFSTAIYPCLIANKSVIWVSGFESEDIHYYNNKVVDSYYSQYSETDNIVHYSRLSESLAKAKPVNRNVVNSIVYMADRHAAERIVEVLEYLYKIVVERNLLLPYLDLSYENYQKKIEEYIANDNIKSRCDVVYIYNLNREYNANLDQFYRLFMTAGYANEEVFTDLKTGLTAIKAKYLDDVNYASNTIESFRTACRGCTVKHIRKYSAELKQLGHLTEDFKSTYVRWLYEERYYQELLTLGSPFNCLDQDLYKTLVKYKNNDINAGTLIWELERFKAEHTATLFPRTLFYTATTLNEIEKHLIFAYLKNWKFLPFLLTAMSFLKRNSSDVKKKLVSCVYRQLPGM